ncbi:MAG: AmmeMemoRadiSam system protein A [Lachnospiraceae bacterium]|nr:AmmeMemoRadiSam system protein A [Lachnospiraceae bacterium]
MGILGGVMVPHPPLIIPEIGKGEEKEIASTVEAYEEAMRFVASLQPETVIVSSPHTIMYRDFFHISPGRTASGDFRRFRAPAVRVKVTYDEELAEGICALCDRESFPAGFEGERDAALDHGTMIPLWFLKKYMPDVKVIRIGLSGYPLSMHYHLGEIVQKAADETGRRVAWIASGDLSHKLKEDGPYGLAPEGPRYDERIMDVMGEGNFEELLNFSDSFLEAAAECGHRSFTMMAGAFDGLAVEPRQLSHEGTFGVGYGVCTYQVTGEDPTRHFLKAWQDERKKALLEKRAREDIFIRIARKSLETYVENGRYLPFSKVRAMIEEEANDVEREELLTRRTGCFVSIHKEGSLRGCIGTIAPVRSCVAEEILRNAVSAAVRDPRFPEITSDELPYLEISVDVLGPTEKIDSPDWLDVKRYGVVVTKGQRRGLLLPNLEGVDTVEQQIAIAAQKAGLDTDEEDYSLERFEVVRHEAGK